jgi:hypothetical protein
MEAEGPDVAGASGAADVRFHVTQFADGLAFTAGQRMSSPRSLPAPACFFKGFSHDALGTINLTRAQAGTRVDSIRAKGASPFPSRKRGFPKLQTRNFFRENLLLFG